MKSIKQHFRRLGIHSKASLSVKSEISSLQAIRATLSSEAELRDSSDLEQDFLTFAADSLGAEYSNPFPSFKLDAVLGSQDELNDFMFYVLERRYGWSESEQGRKQGGNDGIVDHEHVTRMKAELNGLLEGFIHWFLCQSISMTILCSFRNAISKASNRPVVRHQTLIIMMEWLHQNCHEPSFHVNCRQVQELLVCGITDIWSAIRNTCVGRLGPIAECFTLVKLEAFYCSLVKICQSPQSSWQAVEGAVMAVIVILRNFHWVGHLGHSFSENSVSETSFYLKYGHEEMNHLPRFLADTLHSLIYPLLAHPQISIRENATKAFSSFLSRCEFQEALNALDQAVTRLSPNSYSPNHKDVEGSLPSRIPKVCVTNDQFIDAYEAEGLISVCISLIKQIPASYLLKKWSFYFNVFNTCLMHPASTVRQATSTLLKYLVAKSSQTPIMLKLTLQSLVTNWAVGVDGILTMNKRQSNVRIKMGKVQDQPPATEKPSTGESSNQSHSTWEWREGRLLTYELIAKYLVINHVHYFFPPHAIRHARFRGTQSVDACIPSRFPRMSSGDKVSLSKSVDHSSMKQAWAAHRSQSEGESSGSTTPNDSPRRQISPMPNAVDFFRSESDRRKQMNNLDQKRSRTLVESSSKPTLSQYYHDESRRSPRYPTNRFSTHSFSSSLLHLIKDMDSKQEQNHFDITRPRHIPFPTRLSSNTEFENNDLTEDGTERIEKWELANMTTLLSQLLLQTIECLGSDQWELRRMGHQTLPILTEAIRYYDVTLLTSLTKLYLTPVASVMTYGLTLTIKATLQHAKRLEHYEDMSTDSNADSTKSLSILDAVATGVDSWALTARDIAIRPVIDKLSLVAVDVLFLSATSFAQYLHKVTKAEVDATCIQFIMDAFSHAHPNHRYTRYCFKMRSIRVEFDSPSHGYLSILKSDGLHRLCLQIQHALISECNGLLPGYIAKSSVEDVVCILPILLHHVIVFMEDLDVLKNLLEGCRCLVSMVDESECCLYPDEFYTALEYSLLGIIDIINTKVTEVSTLRPVLEFYIVLSQLVSSTYHLTALFKVIHSRLQVACSRKSTLDVCNNDLVYRSNDIPASPVDNQPIADNEDEFDENDPDHPFTISLNASSSSSQLTGISGRGRSSSLALPTDESESDSDWDSWDEDEDDQSVLEELFGDFLRRLQGHYRQMAVPGEMSAFEVRLDMVGVLPNRTIFRLLHTEFLPLT